MREGILDPLSSSILSILRDESLGVAHESTTRAINVLLLFSQVSQADTRVREAFASRTIVIRASSAHSDKALMDRSAESMREIGGPARGTGSYLDTVAGEITSHRSEVDQAPCRLAAID